MAQTVYSSLFLRRQTGHAALLGVGSKLLTYAGLLQQLERTVALLNAAGIGRGDTVAVALRNGPECASLCLAVTCGAICAPLNPDSTAAEFDRYLGCLRPKAIIVEAGRKSACTEVALNRGIPLIWLFPGLDGSFSLEGGPGGQAERPGLAEPGDVALKIHTSGSLSQPKVAALTHENLCHGAMSNVTQLGLTPQDRCLCLTAMFFTQGLLVSVFSSLVAGGSVVCTPGYDPRDFFTWLDEFKPTWYAAPTAVQRSILIQSAKFPEVISRSRLRVIRCSSSVASPDFIAQMEALFRAPVLDSYGLTETSSTIAGQLLNPAARKRGSVGRPVGCEMAVIDERGVTLGPGMVGEVIVRGPGVIRAYDGDPEVNRQSFVNGWLRTGDLGALDHEGYLFLRGRSKEMINRGGVKILPGEIDEILNAHPAVAEGVAFAIPHDRLGEDVAAAVVLRDGQRASEELERELREFCATRLSFSKVPGKIAFVRDLPRTATGKITRVGLAGKLETEPARRVPSAGNENGSVPHGIVEMLLLSIWEDVLDRRPIGIHDDFFSLGGDSLQSAQLLARIHEVCGVDLEPAALLVAPTVAGMAARLTRSGISGRTFDGSKVIAIRSSGSLPPLFILDAQPLYRELILKLPKDLPVLALSPPDIARLPSPFRLEDVAALQVEAIRRFRPHGPYALMGWCIGGVLAYEMAQQLRALGEEVSLVAMVDAFNPVHRKSESSWKAWRARFNFHMANLSHRDVRSGAAYLCERLETIKTRVRRQVWRALYALRFRNDRRGGSWQRAFEHVLGTVVARYVPSPYDGNVMMVRPTIRPAGTYADSVDGWRGLVADPGVVEVPGNHREVFGAPHVSIMASALTQALIVRNEIDRNEEVLVLR